MSDPINASAIARILQHEGRRYALRLEPVFWEQLHLLARRRGLRPGALVALLAAQQAGPNLASTVRSYCLAEARTELARYHLSAGGFDLLDVLRAAPAPGLLLNGERTILAANQALLDWLGPQAGHVQEMKFDVLFQARVTRPLDETFAQLRDGQLASARLQVAYSAFGETPRITQAVIHPLAVGAFFYALVWLHVQPGARV